MSYEIPEEIQNSIFLVGGETNPALAEGVAEEMGMKLGEVALGWHPNGEPYVNYEESVRGKHVFAIQTHAGWEGHTANDSFLQHLNMIDAAKYAFASHITAVAPTILGARQDRKSKSREPESSGLYLRFMNQAGAGSLVTVDPHTPAKLSEFGKPFQLLTARYVLSEAIKERLDGESDDYVIVTPDEGHGKDARLYAQELDLDVVYLQKEKKREDGRTRVEHVGSVGEVEGRRCIMVDDIVDTAGTLTSAVDLVNERGAAEVITAGVHGFLSGPAMERISERLKDGRISHMIMTDTLPLDDARHEFGDGLTVVSVAPMIADSLKAMVTDGSVSELFGGQNYI